MIIHVFFSTYPRRWKEAMVNAAAYPQGHNIIAHSFDVKAFIYLLQSAQSLMNITWQTVLFVPDPNVLSKHLKYQT